jgi:hypothetical protein
MNKGQKAVLQRKLPRIRKSYSLLLRVMFAVQKVEVNEDDDE